jgi:hypothetical protein
MFFSAALINKLLLIDNTSVKAVDLADALLLVPEKNATSPKHVSSAISLINVLVFL